MRHITALTFLSLALLLNWTEASTVACRCTCCLDLQPNALYRSCHGGADATILLPSCQACNDETCLKEFHDECHDSEIRVDCVDTSSKLNITSLYILITLVLSLSALQLTRLISPKLDEAITNATKGPDSKASSKRRFRGGL